jgi:hypothetical protein
MRTLPALLVATLMAFTLPVPPAASQQSPEIDFARQYLAALDQGDFQGAYTNFLAPSFQAQMPLPSFVMSYQNTRQQLGSKGIGQQIFKSDAGRSERQVVGQNVVPTQSGPALLVRFRTIYPNTIAFEDVYMQPTPQGPKVVGTWIAPGF